MAPEIAESTSLLVLRANAMLSAHLARLQGEIGDAEFTSQRRLFGAAMSSLLDIVNPIYRFHPHLKPAELGGAYTVPSWVFSNLSIQPPSGEA